MQTRSLSSMKPRKSGGGVDRRRVRPQVLIVGGNMAGLRCAQGLPAVQFAVTVVDPGSHVEWLPNIHELVSGRRRPDELRLPRAALVAAAGHRFVRARVEAIDMTARVARLDDGSELAFDEVVLAAGGVNATRGVPGVAEHAFAFKSASDCMRIHDALERRVAAKGPLQVTLVGGGIEGVEALGELLPKLVVHAIEVVVVDGAAGFLGGRQPGIDAALRRHLSGLPVTLRFGERVASVQADCVQLASGDSVPTDICIWTGGVAPPAWLATCGLAAADGWLAVDACLQAIGQPHLHAAGDIARLPLPLAHQAYYALDMGAHVAGNLRRLAAGQAPQVFRPAEKPQLVTFGDRDCFLIAGNRAIASPLLSHGKELVRAIGLAQIQRPETPIALLVTAAQLAPSYARFTLPGLRPARVLEGLRQVRLVR